MVKDIFDSISKQMKDDFEKIRVCLSHPGLKGSAFEEVFRNFLASYLPKTLAITQGVIVDVNGKVSRQLDIIIYDALHTPIFFENETTRVIPVECVYAVVEVKAFIDSNEIKNIYTNMLSVRDMQKVALIPWKEEYVTLYGQKWNHWPINYYVFAIDSISLNLCADALSAKSKELNLPVHKRIDSICILNRGLIANIYEDGSYDGLPNETSKVLIVETEKALLYFYSMTARYWFQAKQPVFDFVHYLHKMNLHEK